MYQIRTFPVTRVNFAVPSLSVEMVNSWLGLMETRKKEFFDNKSKKFKFKFPFQSSDLFNKGLESDFLFATTENILFEILTKWKVLGHVGTVYDHQGESRRDSKLKYLQYSRWELLFLHHSEKEYRLGTALVLR